MTISFKQMIKDGTAKRADSMRFRIDDIHEEPGFNLRREGEDLDASVEALADHIASGGMVPPIEVRPRQAGGVFVVDGHRRRRAYLRVADQVRDGKGELWVPVVAFVGNDADRVARIITSAEGRSLSPLEVADGYKRLVAFGWTAEQIATKVSKTRQHVDQVLLLANANSDVQALVAAGNVSATTAIDTVRKHGEGAGEVLADAVGKAKAAGKKKATAGAIKPRALPRGLVDEFEEELGRLAKTANRQKLLKAASDAGRGESEPMPFDPEVVLNLLDIAADVQEAREKQAAKAQAKSVKDAQQSLDGVNA